MRATIVINDNVVICNGIGAKVDCTLLKGQNQHAVHWYESWGEIEFAAQPGQPRPPNQTFADFTPYQPYVDAWEVQVAKDKIAYEAHQKFMEQTAKDQQAKGREDLIQTIRDVLEEYGFTRGKK